MGKLNQEGRFSAVAQSAKVSESKGGALMLNIEFSVAFDDGQQDTITARQCLVSKDGAVMERTIGNLKEAFGWDGRDPFWFEDNIAGKEAEIVTERESWKGNDGKERDGINVRYINPIGAASNSPTAKEDRQDIIAKYGAKLRAVSGAPVK